jgi:Ca2+-binding EF-hand superfamily protein
MVPALCCPHCRVRFWPPAGAAGALALLIQLATVLLAGGSLGAGPGVAQDSSLLLRYEKRLGGWFRRIDRNGDGRISPAEAKGHPFLELNFARLDSAGRGFLLPQDLAPTNNHYLGERLRNSFRQADRDGDGELTLAEAAGFPWLAKHFSQADLDSNGRLTLEEFWALRRSLAPSR